MNDRQIPLPERMRPRSLDEVIGQSHLLDANAPFRRMIDQGHLPSLLLWGPPGIGKTTLASLLAQAVDRPFVSLSAINSGVKELREAVAQGGDLFCPVVFIDEIHRFSKAQQDALLAVVEKGKMTLIGATTENPASEVNSSLLSRCQVYRLEALNPQQMTTLLHRALRHDPILQDYSIELAETEALIQLAAGDARKALNMLEVLTSGLDQGQSLQITNAIVVQAAQQNVARYDKAGAQHYDMLSALIKSIRGSDPDAALYWLARMLQGGEDPQLIARRLFIAASEDIGQANPNALLLAGECLRATQSIGMPEVQIILAQGVIYLATSAKSNSGYLAIKRAMELAEKTAHLNVPLHLRSLDAQTGTTSVNQAQYKYPHDYSTHFVNQAYLPPELTGTVLYQAASNARELEIQRTQQQRWNHEQNKGNS